MLPTQLFRMLQLVQPTISTDETRYHLNGALLESEGDVLRLVSTDGHCWQVTSNVEAANAVPPTFKNSRRPPFSKAIADIPCPLFVSRLVSRTNLFQIKTHGTSYVIEPKIG